MKFNSFGGLLHVKSKWTSMGSPPGPPMTLGNMGRLGVRHLIDFLPDDACRHGDIVLSCVHAPLTASAGQSIRVNTLGIQTHPPGLPMTLGNMRAVVSRLTDDPEHWRKRAEEMRTIANAMTGMARAKESILRVAEQYELKALQAEGRLRGLVHTLGPTP